MSKAGEKLISSASSGIGRVAQRRVFEVASDIVVMTEHGDMVTIPAGTQIPVFEDVTDKSKEGQSDGSCDP